MRRARLSQAIAFRLYDLGLALVEWSEDRLQRQQVARWGHAIRVPAWRPIPNPGDAEMLRQLREDAIAGGNDPHGGTAARAA